MAQINMSWLAFRQIPKIQILDPSSFTATFNVFYLKKEKQVDNKIFHANISVNLDV